MKHKFFISLTLILSTSMAQAADSCDGIETSVKDCQAFSCEAVKHISQEEKDQLMEVQRQISQVFGMLPPMPGGEPMPLPEMKIPDSLIHSYKIIGWDGANCHIEAEVKVPDSPSTMFNCFLSTDQIGAWLEQYVPGTNPAFMDVAAIKDACKASDANAFHSAPVGHQPPAVNGVDSDAVQIKKQNGNDYEWYE